LTAHIHANFDFNYLFISASGTAKIDITDIIADLGIDLSTQAVKGELAPAVKSRDVELVINQDNIAIDLQGDGVAKIADLVKPLIKSLISNQIVQQVKTQLPTIINTNINQDLAQWGVQANCSNASIVFDYALLGTPEVSAKGFVGAKVNGTFFDPLSSVAIPYSPVAMPDRDDAGKDFQLFLSDYTVNSFLFARYQAK
jgi:hypothetical protein